MQLETEALKRQIRDEISNNETQKKALEEQIAQLDKRSRELGETLSVVERVEGIAKSFETGEVPPPSPVSEDKPSVAPEPSAPSEPNEEKRDNSSGGDALDKYFHRWA